MTNQSELAGFSGPWNHEAMPELYEALKEENDLLIALKDALGNDLGSAEGSRAVALFEAISAINKTAEKANAALRKARGE